MSQAQTAPLLKVTKVTKRFPGVTALRNVGFDLRRGEAHAVIGENGAGKSTLMKILAGVQTPDSGSIVLDLKPVLIDSVEKAFSLGIALIHQELNLSDNLDVGANIFLGREPTRGGLINRREIYRRSEGILAKIGLNISPKTLVSRLSIGQQQMIEIARALSVDARILIMDEPTSSLSQRESAALFKVVKELKTQGVSIIYISHRLGEVNELADRVTVLRDGENAGQLNRNEINHDRMVKLMVGRDLSQFYAHQPHKTGAPALEVKDLVVPEHPAQRLSFTVASGEIVGVAGLVGAGRTEMLKAIFGITRKLGGEIRVGGKLLNTKRSNDAIAAGIALVPEDRKEEGLLLESTVKVNIGLAGLWSNRWAAVFMNQKQETEDTASMIAKLAIKTPGPYQVVQTLSGGNQQKVVIGKWLALKPKVLLLDEPTRGIDIGAKHEIYALMEELAEQGVAILFVSSEMEEVLGMSDRTLVMHEGRITGVLKRDQLSEEAVMHLATGRSRHSLEETAQLP